MSIVNGGSKPTKNRQDGKLQGLRPFRGRGKNVHDVNRK